MMLAATAALGVAMLLILIRLFLGPTLYDRVLAANSFGTKTILLIAALGFLTGRPEWLDIALVYGTVNFVSTIAILKFFRYRSFQLPLATGAVARPAYEDVDSEQQSGERP